MIGIIPPTISVTEIQREPTVLSSLKGDEYRVVMKGNREVSVLMSVSLFKQLAHGSQHANKKSFDIPESLRAKIAKIDPVKFQREIRKEY